MSIPRTAAAAAGALGLALVVTSVGALPAAADTLAIADVQGTGEASPVLGATVTVDGVLTADHRTGGYRGVYVQTAGSGGAADATPGASDGVFVFLGNRTTDAVLGDTVQVTGVVKEYFGLTEIDAGVSGGSVTKVGAGVLPEPVTLPATVVGDDREQYEGMLVAPTDEYLVASLHEVDRFGTVWLSAGLDPAVKSTELYRPGPDADQVALTNAARRLLLDDGKNNQVTAATQPYLSPASVVRVGDQLHADGLVYVLSYGFDEWRLQPTVPIDASTPADAKAGFTVLNPRPAAPAEVGGDLRLAAFNVFNYFTTFSDDDPDARGARNQAQFDVQKAKIVAAVNGLAADVVALQEIENSIHFGAATPDAALADLVDGLNAAAGAGTWAYVPTPAALYGDGAPETDVIMSAIIYRPASVTPVGASFTDVDETVWDIAREPIGQVFAPADGLGDVMVVANHFKSKSGDGEEPADGQGQFNAERVEQAGALRDLVAEQQAATGVDAVAIMGDLNSYAHEDPVQVLLDAGYTDVVPTWAPGQWTYTFDGEQGSLDHVLVSPALAARVSGADVWDVNADEWSSLGYFGAFAELGTPYRASDHDAIVLGVDVAAACTVEYTVAGALRVLGGVFRVASPLLDDDWQLTFTAPAPDRYLAGFGAAVRQRGDLVTVTPKRTSTVHDGAVTFAVLGTTGRGGPGTPTGFALDGYTCEVLP